MRRRVRPSPATRGNHLVTWRKRNVRLHPDEHTGGPAHGSRGAGARLCGAPYAIKPILAAAELKRTSEPTAPKASPPPPVLALQISPPPPEPSPSSNNRLYMVRVGPVSDRDRASAIAKQLLVGGFSPTKVTAQTGFRPCMTGTLAELRRRCTSVWPCPGTRRLS